MKILLLDDEQERIDRVSERLAGGGFEVVVVDGPQALEPAIVEHRPSLVVFGEGRFREYGALGAGRTQSATHHPVDTGKRFDAAEMARAIERGEFALVYQPIVSLETGGVSGFEALMRWHHPDRGLVGPDNFIPLAEESGLIIALGFFAVAEAARQVAAWRAIILAERPLSVSVNLSTVQFIHPDLVEVLQETVLPYGLPPGTIRFEITESALMQDMEQANIALLKLKANGFPLYMDDFGTGYSSLSYLRHFPVDVLKIDKSFVRWMGVDEESDEIVRIIIHLAHTLRMKIVAEGVETPETLNKLRELGADYGQGYLFGKPLAPADAEALLRADPRW